MKSNRNLVLVTAVTFAATGLLSSIASAEDTVVQFQALSGSFSISQAASTTVALGFGAVAATAPAVSGDLHDITVTDSQALIGVWCVSTSLSNGTTSGSPAFENASGDEIAGANVRMWIDPTDIITTSGQMTVVSTHIAWATGLTMGTGGQLVNGATILGGGSVTYTPRLGVDIVSGSATGTYTATVTHTASTTCI